MAKCCRDRPAIGYKYCCYFNDQGAPADMSSLIKFGTITKVIHINPTIYEVQLDDQSSARVQDEQIRPSPLLLLQPGVRLAIYEINGVVKWASIDIPDAKDASQDGTFVEERLVFVIEANRYNGIVSLIGSNRSRYQIRLPIDDAIWPKVFRGQAFHLKITRSSQSISYSLFPVQEQPKEMKGNFEEAKHAKVNSDHVGRSEKSTARRSSPSKVSSELHGHERDARSNNQVDEIGVVQVGIDPVYFTERSKEGHRYEIMAFLAEHLHDDLIEWYQMRSAEDARYVPPAKPLHPMIEQTIRNLDANFSRLYSHQARALDSLRAGRNLIVVTQTASGKTLCYNPAIFEYFVATDPSATALYIFPLNALMMDQKEKVDQLQNSLRTQGVSINSEMLKGGLGTEKRRDIARSSPHVLAINPEMLSVILNEPQYWQSFFSNLKFVVVDEVHTYRGILGLHMAGIMRRLLLQACRSGAEPQLILSSATVSNPMDIATRLTSLSEETFNLLTERDDGSFQAYKHWVSIDPDAHANGHGYDNHLTTAAMVMAELLMARDAHKQPSPLNTILFAKSIRDVNKVYKILQENLRLQPDLLRKIRKYISAELNFNEKREIYDGLKTGKYVGVVSTNALEAGIDIGKLDACIIAGFPYSVMRMRQMAGRVGRHQEGLVVFVPQSMSSIDQYYRSNPSLLLTQPPEVFVVDPANPYIARKHINAAAYSMQGLSRQELNIFGPTALKTAQQAIEDRAMTSNGSQFFGSRRNFNDKSDPYAITNIRSRAQVPYIVCKASNGHCNLSPQCFENSRNEMCESLVTTLDRQYAYRDCHPGAIYEGPDGTHYRTTSLDDGRRVIQVEPLPEQTLERTFAEEDISIQILGEPKASTSLMHGVQLQVGEALVTRSFTGYYTYQLEPKRNCRACRREYEATVSSCPSCGRKTSHAFSQSKPKRQDFPSPYHETGFHITLKTVACWMKLPAELENMLYTASPCKLPGEKNKVAAFLKKSFDAEKFAPNLRLSANEKALISQYHQKAGEKLRHEKRAAQETVLYPGVYGQCGMSVLRSHLTEGRSLEVFQAMTGYPVTDNLKHVCRKCQTSVLLQAMHTLEHTVIMRYPSVALGDSSDLGSFSRLGHPNTGAPTIFWYDNYDGGLGAAEKVFEKIQDLLIASERTLTTCSCNSLEGCPHCTHIGHCDMQNKELSKIGLLALIALLRGKQFDVPFEPFYYRNSQKPKFESAYRENEYVKQEHGIGDESPLSQTQRSVLDPYAILRVQNEAHDPVLEKAYEIRGEEISKEVPPISAVELNQAYYTILETRRPTTWNIRPGQDPFKILEILSSASLPMIQKIYRVIARQIHPDTFAGDKLRANEMMKLLNEAFDKARKEKRKDSFENEFDL